MYVKNAPRRFMTNLRGAFMEVKKRMQITLSMPDSQITKKKQSVSMSEICAKNYLIPTESLLIR